MDISMTLPTTVYIIWGGTLLLILIVIVPLAVGLLHRTLTAAWSIRRYMSEMLTSGVGIANNTNSITALNDTLSVAGDMVSTAKNLEDHTSVIAEVLSQRATQGPNS